MDFKNINNIDELVKKAYIEGTTVEDFDGIEYDFEFINNFELGEISADPWYDSTDGMGGITYRIIHPQVEVIFTTHIHKDNIIELLMIHDSIEFYVKEHGLKLLKESGIYDEIIDLMINEVGTDSAYDHEVEQAIVDNLNVSIKNAQEKDRVIYLTIEFEA